MLRCFQVVDRAKNAPPPYPQWLDNKAYSPRAEYHHKPDCHCLGPQMSKPAEASASEIMLVAAARYVLLVHGGEHGYRRRCSQTIMEYQVIRHSGSNTGNQICRGRGDRCESARLPQAIFAHSGFGCRVQQTVGNGITKEAACELSGVVEAFAASVMAARTSATIARTTPPVQVCRQQYRR